MIEENKIDNLVEESYQEKSNDTDNVTYADGEKFEQVESNEPEQFEQTEGDLAPSNEPKEEWQEDVTQNVEEMDKDLNSEVGEGAFSQARGSWSNGWSV